MPIKWLTIREIRAAAKESGRAALECSIKHWNQLVRATATELLRPGAARPEQDSCALCERYGLEDDCRACPVCKKFGVRCGDSLGHSLWRYENAYLAWMGRMNNFPLWREESRAVLKGLKSLRPKKRRAQKGQ